MGLTWFAHGLLTDWPGHRIQHLASVLHIHRPDWLDDTYLRFMALYGLVFPAWILAFMLGRGRWTSGNMAVFIIGLLIALPMAELGMLHASKWWLMPAVATLLASAAIISIRNRQAVASSTS